MKFDEKIFSGKTLMLVRIAEKPAGAKFNHG
jgi:hypothetical protein